MPGGGMGGYKKCQNVLLTLNKSVTGGGGGGGVSKRAKTVLHNLWIIPNNRATLAKS